MARAHIGAFGKATAGGRRGTGIALPLDDKLRKAAHQRLGALRDRGCDRAGLPPLGRSVGRLLLFDVFGIAEVNLVFAKRNPAIVLIKPARAIARVAPGSDTRPAYAAAHGVPVGMKRTIRIGIKIAVYRKLRPDRLRPGARRARRGCRACGVDVDIIVAEVDIGRPEAGGRRRRAPLDQTHARVGRGRGARGDRLGRGGGGEPHDAGRQYKNAQATGSKVSLIYLDNPIHKAHPYSRIYITTDDRFIAGVGCGREGLGAPTRAPRFQTLRKPESISVNLYLRDRNIARRWHIRGPPADRYLIGSLGNGRVHRVAIDRKSVV